MGWLPDELGDQIFNFIVVPGVDTKQMKEMCISAVSRPVLMGSLQLWTHQHTLNS